MSCCGSITIEPLVICISRVCPSTFFGGNNNDDIIYDITNNNSGDVYITGIGFLSNFPIKNGYLSTPLGASQNIFVSKLDQNCNLKWTSIIGGSQYDGNNYFHNIAIDNNNHTYIASSSLSHDFVLRRPNLNHYFDNANTTSYVSKQDAVIVEFDNGGFLKWSTYFGGDDVGDIFYDIAFDDNNNLYACGILNDNAPFVGANNSSVGNAAIVKFNTYKQLVWCTNFGGDNGGEYAYAIKCHGNNVIITGIARNSINFPKTTPNQSSYSQNFGGGNFDAFIAKFNNNNSIIWATYIGNSGDEKGMDITIKDNKYYLIGQTTSSSFPQQIWGEMHIISHHMEVLEVHSLMLMEMDS